MLFGLQGSGKALKSCVLGRTDVTGGMENIAGLQPEGEQRPESAVEPLAARSHTDPKPVQHEQASHTSGYPFMMPLDVPPHDPETS